MRRISLKTVASHLQSHKLAILFGAGISASAPTCLPTARDLISWFVEVLLHNLQPSIPQGRLFQLLNSARPETLYQVIADHFFDSFQSAMEVFRRENPNTCHHIIASLLVNRIIPVAVTTNFDVEVETVLSSSNLLVADTENRFAGALAAIGRGEPVFAKIHGSINSDPKSMAVTIRQVAAGRESAGIKFLQNLISHFDLWVIGYSGADFDVLPILGNAPNSIIWNIFSGELPPGAQKISQQVNGRLQVTEGSAEDVLIGVANELSIPFSRPSECDCTDVAKKKAAFINEKFCNLDSLERLDAIGELLNNTGNLPEAKKIWQDALTIAKSESPIWEAMILNNLAIVCGRLNEWEDGNEYMQRSISIKEKSGDVEALARAFNNYGNYMTWKKAYSDAITAYCKSIILKKELERTKGPQPIEISHSIHGIGRVFKEIGEEEFANLIYKYAEKRRETGVEVDSIQTLRSSALSLMQASLKKLAQAIELSANVYGETFEKAEAEKLYAALQRALSDQK